MKWTVFLAAVALAGGVAISSAEAQCGYYSRVPARGFYSGGQGPYYRGSIGYGPRVYYGPSFVRPYTYTYGGGQHLNLRRPDVFTVAGSI